MKRRYMGGFALAAVAALGLGLANPAGLTEARLSDTAELGGTSLATDQFSTEHADRSVLPNITEFRPAWSTPGELITNKATTGDMRIKLQNFVVDPADQTLRTGELMSAFHLRYRIARGANLTNCLDESQSFEDVSPQYGSLRYGVSNPIEQTWQIVLGPGESMLLCPTVALTDASTTENDIAEIYRTKAAQALKITTTYTPTFPTADGGMPQGSQWGVPTTVTDTYAVNAPVMRIDEHLMSSCGENPFMRPNFVDVNFGWPSLAGTGETSTPAIDHWEVYFRKPGGQGPWTRVDSNVGISEPLLDTEGDSGMIEGHRRSAKIHIDLFKNHGAPDGDNYYALELRFRGYLNLQEGSQRYYVGSDHAVRMRAKDRFLVSAKAQCQLLPVDTIETSLPPYFQP